MNQAAGDNFSRRNLLAATAAGLLLGATGRRAAIAAPATYRAAIDFHTHILDPEMPFVDHRTIATEHLDTWRAAMRSPTAHIDHMDKHGIGAHVISLANAEHGISWGDARHDLALYRQANDRMKSNWIDAYPGRFFGACGVPTQDVALAVEELTRAVRDLGMNVLQLSSCSADGIYHGSAHFDPLWAAIRDLDVTVFFHPHGQDTRPPLDEFALSNSVGQGIEEVKLMTSIIFNGVFDKFPGVKIVIAHGGGFLPHYYGRLDRNARERRWTTKNISRAPSSYLKDFHYDSCVYDPRILRALIDVVGVDRVVLGSDFPVGEDDALAALGRTPGLSGEEVGLISRRNPSLLLGLDS
jgi:aminocarboxymuconate-semialdehyde decarboxylase